MSQIYRYPASAAAGSNASVSTNGAAIPASSTLIAGKGPTGLQTPVKVATDGTVATTESNPITGYALETTQQNVLTQVTGINAKTINTNSVTVVASALPTGASTSALQTTGNTSVASIDTKTPALGQALAAGSVPVVLTASQLTTLTPITGGATETTLAAMSAKLPATLGQKAMAASMAVVLASDQASIPVTVSGVATAANQASELTLVGAVTETAPASDTASSGLNGRLQRIAQRLTSLIALIPASLGQKTSANSLAVVLASDQTSIPVSQTSIPAATGRSKANTPTYRDYAVSGTVTTAAYTQLIASTTSTTNYLDVFDSSGQALYLAIGAAASEVDQFIIFPGGNGPVQLAIPAGSRVSIKAVTASATSGYLVLNLFT